MKGFLFDENLPAQIQFEPSFPITHVAILGKSPSDSQIWKYAEQNDLAIVTKDADFSDRIIVTTAPPQVIHLRFGNMRRKNFHDFLEKVWPEIEVLSTDHRLINVYLDRIDVVK